MMLEDYIRMNAARWPEKDAIVCGDDTCSYRELQERIDKRVAALKTEGKDGQREGGRIVCLRAQPSIDFLTDYFALHLIGCTVAPLDKDLSEEAFRRIADCLEANHVPRGTADILYTTGTTGKAKGVIVSHRAILANAENLIEAQGFTHDLAFVVNGPLNHIGSLSKVYTVLIAGATLIIVDGLKDLNRFFHAFRYPATHMATFLVPAAIRMLLSMAAQQLAAIQDKMAFIETGAAAMPLADMLTLCRLLPTTRLYNTYASTETGIISTHNFNSGKCMPGCLGRPMRHSQVIITPEGRIACKGATLMTGYLGDEERTQGILNNGTVTTSDIGFLDDEGLLHLKGREDDIINVGGLKVDPTEVEDAALSHPAVRDCVCIAVDHPLTGQALKLLVVTTGGEPLSPRNLALHLKTRLERYKIPLLYAQTDHVERTFNGKINRKSYKSPT